MPEKPDAAPPPGGERWSQLTTRVGTAADALPPISTLVLTHGGAMRAALAHLCGLSHAATWAFDLPYAAVIALTVTCFNFLGDGLRDALDPRAAGR